MSKGKWAPCAGTVVFAGFYVVTAGCAPTEGASAQAFRAPPPSASADSLRAPDQPCPDTVRTEARRLADDPDDPAARVQLRCLDESGNALAQACCSDIHADIEALTGCPGLVAWGEVQTRCVDVAGTEVPARCCALACPADASFDEVNACWSADGELQSKVCCERSHQGAPWCDGARFVAPAQGEEPLCRSSDGSLALDACCLSQCAEMIAASGDVPAGCSDDAADPAECGYAWPNATGTCVDAATGRFVKGACCSLWATLHHDAPPLPLDIEASDACVLDPTHCPGPLTGEVIDLQLYRRPHDDLCLSTVELDPGAPLGAATVVVVAPRTTCEDESTHVTQRVSFPASQVFQIRRVELLDELVSIYGEANYLERQ